MPRQYRDPSSGAIIYIPTTEEINAEKEKTRVKNLENSIKDLNLKIETLETLIKNLGDRVNDLEIQRQE
jgi:hypothetical protein